MTRLGAHGSNFHWKAFSSFPHPFSETNNVQSPGVFYETASLGILYYFRDGCLHAFHIPEFESEIPIEN